MIWFIRGLYVVAAILALFLGGQLWAVQASYRHAPQTLADMGWGPQDAKITVVEFLDYRCQACRTAHPVVMQAIEEFPDVRFVVRHLPVFGSQSIIEAQMAITAARAGKFKEMHAILITRDEPVAEEEIPVIAASVGLNAETFRADMRHEDNAKIFYRTLDIQEALKIQQTPSFLIGRHLFTPSEAVLTIEDLRREINAARGS